MGKVESGWTQLKNKKAYLWRSENGEWPDVWFATWTDPTSETKKTWMSPEDVQKTNPLLCLAAGFMVEHNASCIKLCVTVAANGESGQIITIPTKSLDSLVKLFSVGKKNHKKGDSRGKG